MTIKVLPSNEWRRAAELGQSCLVTDNWDDFGFNTLYSLYVFDAQSDRQHEIGGVKIGQFSMKENQWRPKIPKDFDELDERFFSLGQDDSYYDRLNEIGPELRDRVLRALRDVALDQELFEAALQEKVTGVSLLRSITTETVKGQFSRLAQGGARLTSYEFSYRAPRRVGARAKPVKLSFAVEPESHPPTNIHVLIGRNGVGKTHLLNHMARALVDKAAKPSVNGMFAGEAEGLEPAALFANLVSVTFSAFDTFEPPATRQNKSVGIQYAYIGLKRQRRPDDGKPRAPKTPAVLSTEFAASALICRKGARAARWRRALSTLQTDPIFKDARFADLLDVEGDSDDLKAQAKKVFGQLSSGHKIVLLTITRLVETVGERTLVLVDEPEAHLHPPLLSAFVRALSDLLTNRNGVAVIATHSPVVLQEVPSSCAWIIRRSGETVVAERPEVETFGENVGILTREAFGLEVTHSGFHRLLREAVEENAEFEEILRRFRGELGGEAKALVRALLAARTGNQG